MSTPTGYKQTEIGLIPEDWEVKKVEEIASITTGGRDTQDRVEHGTYPFYVRSNTVESINSYSFDGEAVLTSGDGVGVGKIFHYVNGKFDFHQRVYCIYNFIETVSGEYFNYFFATHFYARVMSMTAKSSVDSVRREMISEMAIPLPPTLEEQQAIAIVLRDTDALIDSLSALLAKKQALKTAAMQQLLTPPAQGGKRLPGFDGEWKELSLSALTNQIIDGTHYTPTYVQNGVPFLRVTDIQRKEISKRNLKRIPKAEHDLLIKRCFPQRGDILLSKNGSVGIPKVIDWDWEFSIFVSLALIKLKRDKVDEYFIYHIFNSRVIEKQIKERSKQGTVTNLHLEEIREFDIPLPPTLEEQEAIAKVLSDMDEEIAALETKKQKYQQVKQGLMQELLTGKTRLPH